MSAKKVRYDVRMRDPQSGRIIVVEVYAVSAFSARDKADDLCPFHSFVHAEKVA